jgi:hypothetical protein
MLNKTNTEGMMSRYILEGINGEYITENNQVRVYIEFLEDGYTIDQHILAIGKAEYRGLTESEAVKAYKDIVKILHRIEK